MSNPIGDLADFVLKLKFQGTDDEDTQIRRVRLPRICSGPSGTVSYEELVGLAISFIIPEEPAHASDFEVKLTYKDVDDDVVLIGSSEELMDAIDQFRDQRVLRITAEVKRSTRAKPLVRQQQPLGVLPPSRASNPDGSSAASASSSNSAVRTENTSARPINQGTPVLQNVVESVVNIILNAAVAINRSQSTLAIRPTVSYTPEGVLDESPSPGDAPVAAENPASEPRLDAVHVHVSPPCQSFSPASQNIVSPPCQAFSSANQETSSDVAPGSSPCQSIASASRNVLDVVPPAEEQSTASSFAQEKPTQASQEKLKDDDERPFIHGRHTCDNCLTTPIIGKRYHAMNMSDYDLCEKCFSNHGGTGEIRFEAVELERDRQLQTRWHRRRERMNNATGGPRRGFGPRGHHSRWGPPGSSNRGPAAQGQPQPKASPSRRQVTAKHQPPTHSWKGLSEQRTSEEIAMAEAIRLSMQDIKEKSQRDAIKATLMTPVSSAQVEMPAEGSTELESVASSVSGGVGASVSESNRVASVCDSKEEKLAAPKPSAPFEDEKSLASKSQPVQVETIEDEEEENEVVSTASPFVVRMPSVDGSFVSQVSGVKSNESSNTESKSSRETSFSSDAAGNGEIADMLGETLDRCAEAIDAMVSELDRTSFDAASTASSFVGVNDDATGSPEEEEDERVEVPGADGATILESAEKNGNDSEDDASAGHTEEGWQVVNEDHRINSDEDLARAAQMIGSALFNSDMRSSGEMMSTLTGSGAELDGMSHASSALTSLPSVSSHQIPDSQRQRWAAQLTQLRTLGIDDEVRCVDILERLTAANIGCGSFDEVSVQDVVNALWN